MDLEFFNDETRFYKITDDIVFDNEMNIIYSLKKLDRVEISYNKIF